MRERLQEEGEGRSRTAVENSLCASAITACGIAPETDSRFETRGLASSQLVVHEKSRFHSLTPDSGGFEGNRLIATIDTRRVLAPQLIRDVGVDPGKLLKAKPAKLALAIKPGGMLPELRAQRLQELAFRVENEFGGDLRAALVGPVPKARKLLKSFHGIADPGADRILLFAGILPIAAVPSNCAGVLLRILKNAMGEGRLSGQRCPLTPLSLFLSGGGRAVTAGFRTTLRIWRTVLLRVSESLRTGISRGFPNDGIRACALIIQMPNFAQLHESLF